MINLLEYEVLAQDVTDCPAWCAESDNLGEENPCNFNRVYFGAYLAFLFQ